MLVLLIVTAGCHLDRKGPGTIRILVTKVMDPEAGPCTEVLDPNEILKTIVVREAPDLESAEGTEIARITVRGRDATENNGKACSYTAVEKVKAQRGTAYGITADGETVTLRWPGEMIDDCYFHDCVNYSDTVTVEFLARGGPTSAEILALFEQDRSLRQVLRDPESAEIVDLIGEQFLMRVLRNLHYGNLHYVAVHPRTDV
jgi:hypothetical protein